MAALALTAMAEAAIRARKYFEQFENRLSSYGAFKAYLDNANALIPVDTARAIKNGANMRTVAFPTLTKASLSVITARSCTITGVEPISAKPLLTSITRGFEIRVYPKVSENNYISEIDQMAQGWTNGIRSVLVNLDTFAAARLDSTKSTGLVTTNLTGVAIVANAYQVNLANKDNLYMYLPTLLARNDMGSRVMNNIATTESMALMLKYESMGANNQQNLAAVLAGDLPSAAGFRHYISNRVANGAGVSETHFLVPFGGIGVFTWNDSDARARREGPNGKKSYLTTDDIVGITWDVQEEPICDDVSATYGAGYEKTFGTKYQVAADFGFLEAYSSDTTKANIKVEVMTT